MKTIVLEEPGRFSMLDAEAPKIAAGNSALVKVLKVGICGTDLHAYEGKQPFFSYPRILGHELAVEIVETNGETNLKNGDICAVRPYMNCGECIACRRGISNACENLQVLGVHYDGGMQEFITVPLDHLHPAQGVPVEQLALVEMLSIGAHAVRRANLGKGENVVVIGAGPIGMGTAQFARIVGANVALMDINRDRLAFCRNILGFEHTIDATITPKEALLGIFDGNLPTAVFDATGSSTSMDNSFEHAAHGAKLIFIGLIKGDISFSDPYFHSHELSILASRNATAEDFDWVIESLKNRAVLLDGWITHIATPEEVLENFSNWLLPETGVIKAMLAFQ
jgi:2-desacetyl-2-hydroxyethyl bacteriochlorophyllide A dehydrogenase